LVWVCSRSVVHNISACCSFEPKTTLTVGVEDVVRGLEDVVGGLEDVEEADDEVVGGVELELEDEDPPLQG